MNLIHSEKFALSDFGFTANKTNKAVWVFHNSPENFTGKLLKVVGQHLQTKEENVLISNVDMTVGFAADPSVTKIATTLLFSKSGRWNLDVYVDEVHFGKLNLKVA